MKLPALFLFIGLAVASPLESLDDSFLQEHFHRLLSSRKSVNDRSNDFDYTENVYLLRSIGFCLRNFDVTGIGEAANCMVQTWKDNVASPAMLKSFTKKALESVASTTTVDIELSEDGTVHHLNERGIMNWTRSGTLSIQGGSVPYERNGLLRLQPTSIIFEDLVSTSLDRVNSSAAIYIQVDLNSKRDPQNVLHVEAATTVSQGVGLTARNEDGSTLEAIESSQATFNSLTNIIWKGNNIYVTTEAEVVSSEIIGSQMVEADGSFTHKNRQSKSEATEVTENLNITFAPSGLELSTFANVEGSGYHFSDQPDFRYSAFFELQKSVKVSGKEVGSYGISGTDIVKAEADVFDYDKNPLASVTMKGHADTSGSLKVVAKDQSAALDVHVEATSLSEVLSECASGKNAVVNEDATLDVSVKAKNDGDTATGHIDLKAKVVVKYS